MTLLVSYNFTLSHFYVFYISIEKKIVTMSRANKSNSTSVSLDHRRFKNYSILSRCNSFSSCSNDSAVYSDNLGVQTRFRNSKRPLVNHTPGPHKRSRNSSGSSISSNMSCVSDKDLKSTKIIAPTLNKVELKNCVSNKSGVSRLKYSKINSNSGELKEETIVNKELSCSENSLVILPKQHNLRGKITKKGCACCPSTCTTVVLRRYRKYFKTSEEETVISSTKVKTYVQKGSTTTTPQADEKRYVSTESKPRKRRSELEKLYASLHEIEWAKNFSPDNILSQINVRQAASCSVFGRTQTNTKNLPYKMYKKDKDLNHFHNEIDSLCIQASNPVKSDISVKECVESSCKSNVKSSLNKEIKILPNCDNEQKTDRQTTQITTSDVYHCRQNYKSCKSQSSVNITTCSMSHINVKGINMNSMESVHHAESLITENGTDYSDDAQLSYTSDESSSAVSTSIVNLQSKHLLDFDYKRKNRDLSVTDVSEYSSAPTFFDIAEEGIRTIDACFREVGAEVVVSTCYDEESSLPLLTSIKENKMSNKILSNDDPPILEPFTNVAYNNLASSEEGKRQCKNNGQVKDSSKTMVIDVHDNKGLLCLQSNLCGSQIKVKLKPLKKKYVFSQKSDVITIIIGKKILKKYLKQSQTKSRLKPVYNNKICRVYINSDHLNRSVQSSSSINSSTDLQENVSDSYNHQQTVLCSSSKPLKLTCKTADKKTEMIFKTALQDKCSTNKIGGNIALESTKNSTCFLKSENVLKCQSEIKKTSSISQSSSTCVSKFPLMTSFISTSIENENKIAKEQISRPLLSLGCSFHYNSIRVNRKHNYANIILSATRGKSMFLTLEVLTELKDALNRTNNDSSCQVLIVNGVGDSFCLGLDLKPLIGPRKKLASTEMAVAVKEFIEALSEFKKPLAAVVNGPALGLGMTLLNHADFTIASDKATFCMPYSYLGYMPEGGATLTLPQIVGSTVAMDLLLRGKILTAREARNVGLISEVLEAKRLAEELVSRVRMLAENPLSALETTKALLKMQLHVNLRLVLENEVKLLPRMWLTRTCQDALRRALESGILSE